MKNQSQLINLLADGKFHSGEEIAKMFGVSRAAVWKKLSKLKIELGLDLTAIRGRGYALKEPLDLLKEKEIMSALTYNTQRQLTSIELFQQIESTNAHLMQLVGKNNCTGTICLAEQQIAGRGRLGRTWVSPFGANVYMSVLWRFSLAPADLGGLSLAAGVGVVRCLKELGADGIQLKWPNDILFQEKKLAGLLLEMTGEQGGPSDVVLGVGLNANMTTSQGSEIDQPWVTLKEIGRNFDISRNQLTSSLINHIFGILREYETTGLSTLIEEWRSLDAFHQLPVRISIGNRSVDGVQEGIDESGALLVRVDGELQTFHGGEVSLRAN